MSMAYTLGNKCAKN